MINTCVPNPLPTARLSIRKISTRNSSPQRPSLLSLKRPIGVGSKKLPLLLHVDVLIRGLEVIIILLVLLRGGVLLRRLGEVDDAAAGAAAALDDVALVDLVEAILFLLLGCKGLEKRVSFHGFPARSVCKLTSFLGSLCPAG